MRTVFLILLFSIVAQTSWATEPTSEKVLNAKRLDDILKVDGALDEPIWLTAPVATDFIQNRPNPGKPASQRTEVRVLYDDEAIYVGAKMFDISADSILHQLSQRDQLDNTDFFGVWFSCFNDGINAFEFIVTPDGVQFDAQVSTFGEDTNWNAVWQCNTSISEDGWIAEFKIPYSAIRFPEAEEQQWSVNFTRRIRRLREQSFWFHVDPEVPGFVNQSGILKGIENITPPPRLFFFPYASSYFVAQDDGEQINKTFSYNGGMDVKYGINESFTLDMTLIPDFGQVQSDNLVLNLSPFEVQFAENRQFFTEGTELFNKGGLFYSRRIGGRPINRHVIDEVIQEDETIVALPRSSQLINATKVSGRNQDGLGIGFFNAVTKPTYAVLENEAGEQREIEIAPLTNYNIVVFDQNLKNNSYVSLINTNVLRNGATYDANVVGTSFDVRNKSNRWSLNGSGAYNKKFNFDDPDTDDGFRYNLEVAKMDGQLNFGLGHGVESDTYDHNDLGFLYAPNDFYQWAWVGYNIYEPFWKLNSLRANFSMSHSQLYAPRKFSSINMNGNLMVTTKKFNTYNVEVGLSPVESYDYFEPRVDGLRFTIPSNVDVGGWISSDYRKRIALDAGLWMNFSEISEWRSSYFRFAPRFRINDKLMLTYVFSNEENYQERGFTDLTDDGEPVFGRRDRTTYTNVMNVNYIFNNRMGLTFRMRHYWSNVTYNSFHELNLDGTLGNEIDTWMSDEELAGFIYEDLAESSRNTSFNTFNIDLVYTWVFSPGSEIRVVWKNSILDADRVIPSSFGENLERTMGLPQTNNISIKILYFLDYLTLTKRGRSIEN